jgi:hypothetical protein
MNQITLSIPQGTPGAKSLDLDMGLVRLAEQRLPEVRMVSPVTAAELSAFFNEACAQATKYLAWIEYQILVAEKNLDFEKSRVILDVAPEEFKKMKDTGIKYNEDFRNALIARDSGCQTMTDIYNSLQAAKALITGHADSFKRAHYSCKEIASAKSSGAATPHINGAIGQTYEQDQDNFIGKRRP